MRIVVVIPARYGSTRFPGKPLIEVRGASMIRRVAAIGRAAEGVDRVVVATDDDRIAEHVRGFGGEAIMTPESCRNGTERAFAAAQALMKENGGETPDVVINLQGDAILTPPWIVGAVAKTMRENPDLAMATPASRMDQATYERFKTAKAAGNRAHLHTLDLVFGRAIFNEIGNDFIEPFRHNIGIDAGRPQMIRAVLEGVAHQVRWLLEVSEQVVKHPIVDLRGIGGGAQSDLWCQIHADVIGRPVHRVADPLVANVRGAALFAGLVTERLQPRDVTSCATVDRVFRPDPDAAALYQERHQEFVGLHKELKGVARRLHRITAHSR